MTLHDRVAAAAAFLWRAHQGRERYRNLPDDLRPASIDEAYAAQEAFHALAAPARGPIVGVKIATTTKVMQALMGIDHPCGGAIFANTVHHSPARLRTSDFVNLRIECEIAVQLRADLPAGRRYGPEDVRGAIGEAMAAFELIEDRHAVYKETAVTSLIADNCWNAGIVLGPAVAMRPDLDLEALRGRLAINGRTAAEGAADDPLGALAWLANLAIDRGRPLVRGMIAITGSLVATASVSPGDTAVFAIEGLGVVKLALD